MAIIYPDSTRGSTRPYGYATRQTQTGAGTIYIGIPSDVHRIGIQIAVSSAGSYFIEGTLDPASMISPTDTASWSDLYGNGTDAQTTGIQFEIGGSMSCIRLRVVSGTMVISTEMRRV